jgi:selenocysteine lyase/cysteine desulfurase
MTTLTLHMSRCLGKKLKRGDEIVLSRMDHDANVAPWLLLADDLGLTVRWMEFDTDTYEFPDDALTKVLTDRTKILAMGMASNCTGTVNDVKRFTAEAKAAGAIVYLDAVQVVRAASGHSVGARGGAEGHLRLQGTPCRGRPSAQIRNGNPLA